MRWLAARSRRGNILAMVVLIMALLFLGAIWLTQSSVERGRQTWRSLAGDQAGCLAEAALMRAVHRLSRSMNDPASFKREADAKTFALLLRYPLKAAPNNPYTFGGDLGKDELLDVKPLQDTVFKNRIELTAQDLRLQPEGEDTLDRLVAFMGDGKVTSWEVKVTVEVDKAFRITAKKPEAGEFKVPGIDIEFSTRQDVLDFLENKGRMAFLLYFPDWLKLFNFAIPIKVWIPLINKEITLATIDPTPVIDLAVKPLTKGSTFAQACNRPDGLGLNDYFTLDVIARMIAQAFDKPDLYPFKILYDENFFPALADLWPAGLGPIPVGYEYHIEKYGELKMRSEARLTFRDRSVSERRIEATKEFKVSDIQPMAPLYSFFAANLSNDRINFNDYGGSFYVNNSGGRIQDRATREKNKEMAGQIRINYKPDDFKSDEEPGSPLLVNCSLMGDWKGPRLAGNGVANTFLNLAGGIDGLMMLGRDEDMVVSQANYTLDFTFYTKSIKVDSEKLGIPNIKGLKFEKINRGWSLSSDIAPNCHWLNKDPKYKENRDRWASSIKRVNAGKWWAPEPPETGPDKDNKAKINFIPDISKLSCTIIHFGISIALRGLGQSAPVPGVTFGEADDDCFVDFELPWMGTRNSLYTLPSLGWGQNKTHFFGINSIYPTLSRDIEGMVVKRYRQWHVTIIGLTQLDRLPLLPFPPPWCFVPPVPVPVWFTDEVINKYDFNLWFMKPFDVEKNAADTALHMYDPEKMINCPANFYTVEQYAKKATYFYPTWQAFLKDLPNRMIDTPKGKALLLNGVTFIAGSLGSNEQPFAPPEGDTLQVIGKGMIVCSGNIFLGCHIRCVDEPAADKDLDRKTVFSLIARQGGLVITKAGDWVLEGSLFTNVGLYVSPDASLNIQGNWVTNRVDKMRMQGHVMIDFLSSRVRASLGSLHPKTGKFDPRRYHVTLSPRWSTWKVD
ncbi:MAG: hypothetical protein OZSIB_0378 [Candidatus Ozemobacter sibiricus]|uniref:Uncharacterized protein n=1 Tax=Candidatus Ozemobacter sibiricus TaxID=2268124 RepID=A0A367ZLY3_9BACT|nr:MAG: hypothetical protein OZSIB_0378 [Candidatus Ozemobacter sibiricus]